MPVKDASERCVVNIHFLRDLIQHVHFCNKSSQFRWCKYSSALVKDGKIEETRLASYIKEVGSDQVFRDSLYDLDKKAKSVTCGGFVYFVDLESELVYRGKIDDVDYTETGSIIFKFSKKDGAEK